MCTKWTQLRPLVVICLGGALLTAVVFYPRGKQAGYPRDLSVLLGTCCSSEELTKKFARLDGTSKAFTATAQGVAYRVVLYYPKHWTTSFDCYVYEEVDVGVWLLRSAVFVSATRSGSVECIPRGTQLDIYHDGQLLQTVFSAARQVREQRLPP